MIQTINLTSNVFQLIKHWVINLNNVSVLLLQAQLNEGPGEDLRVQFMESITKAC